MTEEVGVGVGAALYSWGSNSEGALGLNDISDRFSFYVMWTIHEKKRHADVLYYFSVLP
jgi:alpha-tubulin suppressor-like RCC1 family protein